MREMSCEPYSGEQNAEVVGRWIRKVEKTMIQIKISHIGSEHLEPGPY
jgi:hypothetical protein